MAKGGENTLPSEYSAAVKFTTLEEIIQNPEIIGELANVVINPQSENSSAYQFCEAMVDCFVESDGDEVFLEAIVDDETGIQINKGKDNVE